MKDRKKEIVEDEIELTDDQLENVVGGINMYNDSPYKNTAGALAKSRCKSCGGQNVNKSFKSRSVVVYECQDCGYSWEERAF